MCVCVTFVISTDHESYTSVISTNLGSMEVGEIKLTRENFFPRRPSRVRRGRRAAVDFVVFRVGRIFRVFFFIIFFFERTRPTASIRLPLYLLTSLLVMRQARDSEATEAVFCL